MVACEGPVGKPGEKGEKGEKGETGDSGTQGVPGVSQLVALSPSAILIDDADDEGTTVLGAGPTGLSAASYFRGGKAPVTYGSARAKQEDGTDTASQAFNLVAATDGAITITKLTALGSTESEHYTMGDMFTITATDADGVKVPANVTVKRNRAPLVNSTLPGDWSNNSDTQPATIGSQDGFVFGAAATVTADPCMALNTTCIAADVLEEFFEQIDGDSGTTYVIREKNPDSVTAAMSSDGKLVISGSAPILDGTTVKNARIFFKAIDSNDLESKEQGLWFRVDPGVVIAPGLPRAKTLKATNVQENLVVDVADFFSSKNEQNTDDTLEVRLVGAANAIIDNGTPVTGNFFDVEIDNDNLVITPKNQGSGDVVIIGREGADGQWATHTISITVTANS
jgi:hypothetical protein